MAEENVLGQKLRQIRKAKNLSLKNVADAIGVQKGTIGNIERGDKPASLEMVKTLADFFDVSIDFLLGRTDNPHSHKL